MTRRTSKRARLPAGAWRRFFAALAVLLAAIVGVPVLLVACSHAGLDAPHPLPAIGSGSEIRAYFERGLSPTEIAPIAMRVLLIVGWLLWLAMVLSVLAAVFEARGTAVHRWVPRFTLFAALSRWIAAGLTAVSTLAPSFVSAATLASPRPYTVSSITPEQPATVETPVAPGFGRVQRGESVETFAHRVLGDAARWPEIWELNKDSAVGPDGEVWTAPWKLGAGWDLRLPAGATPLESHALPAPPVAKRPAAFAPPRSIWAQRDTLDVIDEYEVVDGDSFWAIAERFLPEGSSERDVWEFTQALMDFNAPRLGYAHPAMLRPGDVIDIVGPARSPATAASSEPAAAGEPPTYTVVAGDSYWEIAESTLGDGASDGEVLELTTELIELNSTRLGYPDPRLIHPGDVVHLIAPPAPTRPVPTIPPVREADRDAVPIDGPRPASLPPPVVTTTLPPPPTTTSTTPPTTTTSSLPPPTVPPADTGTDGGSDRSGPSSPIGLGQLGLIATGVVALLAARRRARLRAAEPPTRVPLPSPEMTAMERQLRRLDAAERLLRIDIALRAAASDLLGGEQRVVAVRSAPDGTIELHLGAAATLGEPWTGSGCRWTMDGRVPVDDLSGRARAVGAPCVALTQVGVDDDGWDVLVDLEAAGVLCVAAESPSADDVVRAIAVGLATSEFAEVAHLIGVGLDEDAFLGHRHAQVVSTVDEAIELAATLIGTTSTKQSTFTLRARHTGGEVWEPAVIVVAAASAGELSPDIVHSIGSHGGLALVVAGQCHDATWRLRPDGEKWLLDPLGLPLQPAGIDPKTLDELADVVGNPVVADHDSGPHVLLVDVEPTPPAFDTVIVPLDGNGHHDHSPADVPSLLLPDSAASGEEYADPPWSLMVRLLGNVEVVDRSYEAAKFERSKTLELVTWLVTHRGRASRSAARTALWELDVRDATFANVVSEARRTMARHVTPPRGDEWLRRTMTDELSLHDEVVADADVVRARFEQARSLRGAEAMALLRPAVELVNELPFSGTSYLWPDPEGITSGLVVLATNVTAQYARLALAAGDPEGVFWSTGRGLQVLPGQEALIGLRMRAHAEAGDLSGVRLEWETYEKVICADPWSDGEPAPKLVALRQELLSK